MMLNKRLIAAVGESKKYIAANVVLQWLALVANIAMMGAIAALLQGLYAGEDLSSTLLRTAVVAAAALAVRYGCSVASARMSYLSSKMVKRTLREKIYQKLLRLGASYKEQVNTSQVVQVAVEGVDQLETYFGAYLPQFFYAMLAPLTLFGVLAFINPALCGGAAGVCAIDPGDHCRGAALGQKTAGKILGAVHRFGGYLFGKPAGPDHHQDLPGRWLQAPGDEPAERAFPQDHHEGADHAAQLHCHNGPDRIWRRSAGGDPGCDPVPGRAGGPGGMHHDPAAGGGFLFAHASAGQLLPYCDERYGASDKIFRLLDLPEPEQKIQCVPQDPSICMEQVCFSYQPGREVLHAVDMEFPQGSFTALVGESGCGKSTIAGILMGRNKHYAGQVLVGGVSLDQLSEQSLNQNITYISHQSYLFKGTVRENLLLAAPQAEETALWQVLEQVRLADFLRSGQGLDTPVAEQGSNLSGGQRQRLALARALLHDSRSIFLMRLPPISMWRARMTLWR